jgi:hypothetical protein
MATDASHESPARTSAGPVREILVRDTFLNRVWTILAETLARARTRSVLHLAKEPVVAPAKPVANKLEIIPLFKRVFVAIAALTSFCLLVGMLFTLRYPDPPAIQSAEFCFELARMGFVTLIGLLGGKAL